MKIAIAHDYFAQLGGAELVAQELYNMFPDADMHSLVAFPEAMPAGLKNVSVQTTWMQHLPWIRKYFRMYFLLYPYALKSMDLKKYDLVISSTSGYAKGIATGSNTLHICYCHTPTRWIWNYSNYAEHEVMNSIKKVVLGKLTHSMRQWDKRAALFPDHFIANSQTVAERIYKIYHRSAEVIHPPIDINRFRPCKEQEDYYLILARLLPYKRIDLAVAACTKLNRRLLVIGKGPDRKRLESMAGPSVTFLGKLSNADVEHYVSHCRALLFPGEEDFGMAPLEVAAAGRPTIAYRAGGALETIVDGVTGIYFSHQESRYLERAILDFEQMQWSQEALCAHAAKFSVQVFQNNMRNFIAQAGYHLPAHRAQLVIPQKHASLPVLQETKRSISA